MQQFGNDSGLLLLLQMKLRARKSSGTSLAGTLPVCVCVCVCVCVRVCIYICKGTMVTHATVYMYECVWTC